MEVEGSEQERRMLLSVQTMMLADHIDRNGDGVVNCGAFERIIRDGFARIAQRDDLGEMADTGLRLLEVEGDCHVFADWLDIEDFFESACRMYATYSGFKAEQEEVDDVAAFCADMARSFVHYCDTYPCFSPETPDRFRRAAMANFQAVCDELAKLNFHIRDVEIAAAPVTLQ